MANRRRAPEEYRQGPPRDVYKKISAMLTVTEVAQRYDVQPNRHGYCICPFHTEKTASMLIYPNGKGFYCFGCGVGGGSVEFAQHYFNLATKREALQQLDKDFGLGFFSGISSGPARSTILRRMTERQETESRMEEQLKAISKELKRIHDLPPPRPGAHDYAARYALEQANAEYLEYLKEEIYEKGGPIDWRTQKKII